MWNVGYDGSNNTEQYMWNRAGNNNSRKGISYYVRVSSTNFSVWGGSGHGISAHHCTVPPLSLIDFKSVEEGRGGKCVCFWYYDILEHLKTC